MEDFGRERFVELCRRLFPRADWKYGVHQAVAWHSVLWALYDRRPGREYHNTGHILDLLRRLDAAEKKFVEADAAEAAIWFHDAIYEAGVLGCEERSAALARSFVESFGLTFDSRAKANDVCAIVLATKHDGADPYEATRSLVVDLDLAGFADPWEVFDERNAQIRAEFARVDDAAYRWGRLRFLAGLMSRSEIYRVLTHLEAPARANIERHMRELMQGPKAHAPSGLGTA